jgi:hypothetical protein
MLLPAIAQNSSPPANPPATINQRKENQQDRIANGVASGQLTAGETANLEKKESDLNFPRIAAWFLRTAACVAEQAVWR